MNIRISASRVDFPGVMTLWCIPATADKEFLPIHSGNVEIALSNDIILKIADLIRCGEFGEHEIAAVAGNAAEAVLEMGYKKSGTGARLQDLTPCTIRTGGLGELDSDPKQKGMRELTLVVRRPRSGK